MRKEKGRGTIWNRLMIHCERGKREREMERVKNEILKIISQNSKENTTKQTKRTGGGMRVI